MQLLWKECADYQETKIVVPENRNLQWWRNKPFGPPDFSTILPNSSPANWVQTNREKFAVANSFHLLLQWKNNQILYIIINKSFKCCTRCGWSLSNVTKYMCRQLHYRLSPQPWVSRYDENERSAVASRRVWKTDPSFITDTPNASLCCL